MDLVDPGFDAPSPKGGAMMLAEAKVLPKETLNFSGDGTAAGLHGVSAVFAQ